ncbi:cytochrome c [Chromatiaceae bacterium AAb-1]|jgi:cytochrome c553|nr:cytochrome c [Chromatiaceae bacterium AAb-1]
MLRYLALMLLTVPAVAADIEAGRRKAAICGACHGTDGIAVVKSYPDLAGKKAADLELALKGYRDGSRRHALMSPMARGLSDQDISELAAYFSSLPAD